MNWFKRLISRSEPESKKESSVDSKKSILTNIEEVRSQFGHLKNQVGNILEENGKLRQTVAQQGRTIGELATKMAKMDERITKSITATNNIETKISADRAKVEIKLSSIYEEIKNNKPNAKSPDKKIDAPKDEKNESAVKIKDSSIKNASSAISMLQSVPTQLEKKSQKASGPQSG